MAYDEVRETAVSCRLSPSSFKACLMPSLRVLNVARATKEGLMNV